MRLTLGNGFNRAAPWAFAFVFTLLSSSTAQPQENILEPVYGWGGLTLSELELELVLGDPDSKFDHILGLTPSIPLLGDAFMEAMEPKRDFTMSCSAFYNAITQLYQSHLKIEGDIKKALANADANMFDAQAAFAAQVQNNQALQDLLLSFDMTRCNIQEELALLNIFALYQSVEERITELLNPPRKDAPPLENSEVS